MNRQALLELWSTSWDGDGWFTPWTRALADLTHDQAAWKPAPGRHSIWQNVSHVAFWREYNLVILADRPKPTPQDIERGNFEEPTAPSADAWAAAKRRLEQTHREIGEMIADPARPLDRVQHHLAHDAYHLGQIMQTRAPLGLPPVV